MHWTVAHLRAGLVFVATSLGTVGLMAQATIAKPPTAEKAEFFEATIRPLLADNCFQCHS